MDKTYVITGAAIPLMRLITLRSALKLEVLGMKGRANAYAIIKREFGLKGTRKSVLEQFNTIVEKAKADFQR